MSESITRRGLLTGAAAIAGATALPQFLRPDRPAIGHVVVDERLADSADFAAGFAQVRLHPIDALDDLCNRWYTQLRREVQASAGHIAGLTTWMDYIVMRSCAAEIGYSRAFHAEHQPGSGALEHCVSDHPDLLAQVLRVSTPQSWARAMGQALASGSHLRSRFASGEVFSATVPAAAAGHVRMVSWVFSPRG